jgi:AraC family transcriptional regulator, transcriptional activator FtrA
MNGIIWRILMVLVPMISLLIAATVGYMLSMRVAMATAPHQLHSATLHPVSPPYTPHKPTVAIVLGDPLSEVTDVLGPYALFAESDMYNVYTVAATPAVRTLSGGLDIRPHYTFAELDALLGHKPSLIVIPAIPGVQTSANAPVHSWLRQAAQHGSVLFSWCTGAEVLAFSGVLDGQRATAHWGDIDRLERTYPQVQWQRGVRYVDEGTIVSSAGLTSGIDATLALLTRLHGPAVAQRVAHAIHYPSRQFLADPTMAQYHLELADSTYMLNAAFYWPKQRAGVWLYPGVDELSLAAIFDVYTASWTHQAFTVSNQPLLTTRHGLQVLPRWHVTALPPVDQLLIPQGATASRIQDVVSLPTLEGVPMTDFTAASMPEFAMETTLEAFAHTNDWSTARFAAKRLEYRETSLNLQGPWVALRSLAWPLLIMALSVGVLVWYRTHVGRRSKPK